MRSDRANPTVAVCALRRRRAHRRRRPTWTQERI